MTGRPQVLSPEQETGGASGKDCFRGGAPFAVPRRMPLPERACPMLPPAMSVRCTMTCPPMRTPLGERNYCFFVVRRVSRGNLELTPGHFGDGGSEAPAIALCKCVVRSITRSTNIRGRIPPRRRVPFPHFVDVVLLTSVHRKPPRNRACRALWTAVRRANQGGLAIVGT